MKKVLFYILSLIFAQGIYAAEISGTWKWVSGTKSGDLKWGASGHTGNCCDFTSAGLRMPYVGMKSEADFRNYDKFASLPAVAADYVKENAYMVFSGNTLTAYRADGTVISTSTISTDIYADGRKENWELGKLKTSGGGVLFPYKYDSTEEVKDFDIMYYDGQKLILAYTEGVMSGSYEIITTWQFENTERNIINGINYILDDATQTATVASLGGTYSGELDIPEKIGNLGTAYTVTAVGDGAFSGCEALTKVTLPSTVKSIGSMAFALSAINRMNIPMGVEEIKDYTFCECTVLTSVAMPGSLKKIGNNAFYKCVYLDDVEIPALVSSIGNSAFESCRRLVNLHLPTDATSIGEYAFKDCISLQTVTLPQNLTELSGGIFTNCEKLSKVELQEGIKAIQYNAFANCESLESIDLPSTLVSIKSDAFANTGLKSIFLPASLATLDGSAFSGSKALGTVQVASENKTFTALDNVVFSKDMQKLVMYSSGLTRQSYRVPEGTRTLEPGAIMKCDFLQYLQLPSTLREMKIYALAECNNLKYVTINAATVPATDEYTSFVKIPVSCILEVPEGTKDAYNASRWRIPYEYESDVIAPSAFSQIEEKPTPKGIVGTCTWELYDGVLTISPAEGETTGSMPQDDFNAPWANFVEEIYAVVYEEGVTNTGVDAFAGYPFLTSVEFAASVQTLDDNSFVKCVNLKSITFMSATPPAMSGMAFSGDGYELHVPMGSKAAYEAAGFADFCSEVFEDVPTGIECLTNTYASSQMSGIYSVSGTRQATLSNGMNIVKMNDGSVRKILVK